MKRTKKSAFFIIAILILLFTVTSFFGVYGRNGDFRVVYVKGAQDIRWGIDIRGGVEATFSPAGEIKATENELDSAKAIIEQRLVSNSITDYELYTDYTSNRIIVRFPWKSDEVNFNPEEAIEELAATAHLTFREGNSYAEVEYGADGSLIYKTPTGVTESAIILEGSDVVKAESVFVQDPNSGALEYQVSLEFSEEGTKKFSEATGRLIGSTISIWMDDVMISFPTVQATINDGKCVITGDFSAEEAKDLANKIQAGALPFALETSNFSTINPTLGMTALDAMLLAGVIAFGVISVLMFVFFRLPGVTAIIGLLGQLAISFAAISGYFPFMNSFTMTLPGIAGIILSIGVGVDANIITASRIKEELKNGKSLDGAILKGCNDSFWAIFDGNITILIVAIMLIGVFGPSNILSWIFGASTTGSIYSFGYTLLVGVIANFIMGIFATRTMMKSLSGFKPLRKKWLFGGAGNE